MNTKNPSFAAQHADPAMGFNVVPRWFRASPFWQALKLEHRAILDELFHMVRRLPEKWRGQIDVGRGQFVMTQDAVATHCWATRKQVRLVMEKAAKEGILGHRLLTWTDKGKTNLITLVTWHDFELYDRPQEQKGKSKGQTPGQPKGQSKGHNNTETHTESETKSGDRVGRERAASPPAASGGSPDQAAGVESLTSPARETTDPPAKPKSKDDVLRLIQSDPSGTNMVGYWCYGPEAVGRPMAEWAALEPEKTHWAPTSRNYGMPEPDAEPPALAAYCWCRFSQARGQAGERIEQPAFSKLVGTIKSVRGRMPQEDLVGLIDRIAANWPAIKAALSSWMSSPPVLNELTLNNQHVVEQSNRIGRGESIAPRAGAASAVGVVIPPDVAAELEGRTNRVRL